MKTAKFTIAPIVFITLIVVGVIICYFTGRAVLVTFMDVTKMLWPFKVLTVFLGGLLWTGLCFVILMLVASYNSFKETFFK